MAKDARVRAEIQGLANVHWLEDILPLLGFYEVPADPDDRGFKLSSDRFVRKWRLDVSGNGRNPVIVKIDRSRWWNQGWINIRAEDLARIKQLLEAR